MEVPFAVRARRGRGLSQVVPPSRHLFNSRRLAIGCDGGRREIGDLSWCRGLAERRRGKFANNGPCTGVSNARPPLCSRTRSPLASLARPRPLSHHTQASDAGRGGVWKP